MLKLLKYELRKTMMAKLLLLGVTAIAEAAFLIGFWTENEDTLATSAALLFLIAVSGITLMGILSVITLHRDMNTRQGYMLFMTPNSCYRILGAKVIECALSVMIAGAFFFALGLLDFSMLLGKDSNERIWDMFTQMMKTINERIVLDAPTVAAVGFSFLASWLCTITTAYLADVVASSLLYGKKANWIVTFILFIALDWGISWLIRQIPDTMTIVQQSLWQGAAALGLAAVMYVVTARLMDRYLSV